MSDSDQDGPRILARPDHPISRKNISRNTLKVLYRLDRSGHKAYMVGGSVRDLLLGREPKDFDISTDARPEEIRRLFRNSRIIGRRFRLAHVYFKGEVVEVATFRREPDPSEQKGDDDLLITSDNTWGTPREDAFRRDFTINALFYDISDFSIIDYVGGIDDLDHGVVRTIGDPDVRFREDPVRMLRACEFAGRLGFDIDRRSQRSIRELCEEVEKAAPARLTEEVIQLLKCGRSAEALDWMLQLGLSEVLLPELEAMVESVEKGPTDLSGVMAALDYFVREGREFSDIALLALLILPRVMVRRHVVEVEKREPLRRNALEALIGEQMEAFLTRFTISKVRAQHIQNAVYGFLRMCEPNWQGAQRMRFARKPYFQDALSLFEVLVEATGEGREALAPWRKAAEKATGSKRGGGGGGEGRRRRSRRKKGGQRGEKGSSGSGGSQRDRKSRESPKSPKKRRRPRRRGKRRGGGDG